MMKRCVVIGAMPVNFPVEHLIDEKDFIICADGGYLHALSHNIAPNMIVGDFDSSNKPSDIEATVIALPTEKDDTDTYHVARYIVENNFTDVLLCGVTGGRIEHTLANIQTLVFLAKNRINATIIDENSYIMALKDGEICLAKQKDKFFSIFSMDEKSLGVTIKGAKYPLENVELTNDFPVGISNEFKDEDVYISVEKGTILLVITNKQ